MSLLFAHENGFDAFETPDGTPRLLTLLPPKPRAIPRFSDVFDVIVDPRDWEETHHKLAIGDRCPRYDQGHIGRCEPTSEVEAIGQLRAWAGLDPVALSASMLYALILNNNPQDTGAEIGAGLPHLQTIGVATQEACPEGWYLRSQLGKPVYESARNFRVISAFHCPTFAEIATALILKKGAIVFGVRVGDNFNKLDSEFVCPVTPGTPNHAVSAWDLVRLKSGQWGIDACNHWTRQWGNDGDFVQSQDGYEALSWKDAICYVSMPIDVADLPPPVKSVA